MMRPQHNMDGVRSWDETIFMVEVDVTCFEHYTDEAFGENSVGAAIDEIENLVGWNATDHPCPAKPSWTFRFDGHYWIAAWDVRKAVIRIIRKGLR